MTNKAIGLIGIGKMGYGIGFSLITKGCDLYVMGNNNREGLERLIGLNAKEVHSLTEMAGKCRTIILSLPSSAEVEDVLFGLKGLENNIRYQNLVIDTTTGDPALSLKIAERLASRSIRYVDAPVTRGPKEAAEGRLNTILGGEDDMRLEAHSVVSLYSEFIFPTEGIGSAHKLKLLNNALSMGVVALTAEICAAAEKLDINLSSLRELVKQGGVNSGLLQGFLKCKLDGCKESLNFTISNAEKDLRYFDALCDQHDYDTHVTKSVHKLFLNSVHDGAGHLTLSSLINSAH